MEYQAWLKTVRPFSKQVTSATAARFIKVTAWVTGTATTKVGTTLTKTAKTQKQKLNKSNNKLVSTFPLERIKQKAKIYHTAYAMFSLFRYR